MIEGSRRIGHNHSIKAMFPRRTQESSYRTRTYKLPEVNNTDSYEHKEDLNLFYFQDGSSHTLGIASYVSKFLKQYENLRQQQKLPEKQLNAEDVTVIDLTPLEKKRLNRLLELDFSLSLEAITDNPHIIFFNPIEIVRDNDKWKQWREEIKNIKK